MSAWNEYRRQRKGYLKQIPSRLKNVSAHESYHTTDVQSSRTSEIKKKESQAKDFITRKFFFLIYDHLRLGPPDLAEIKQGRTTKLSFIVLNVNQLCWAAQISQTLCHVNGIYSARATIILRFLSVVSVSLVLVYRRIKGESRESVQVLKILWPVAGALNHQW